jgi:hypothetical protein
MIAKNEKYFIRTSTRGKQVQIECGDNSKDGTMFLFLGDTLDGAMLNMVSTLCSVTEESGRLRNTIEVINISCKSVII